MFITVYVQLLTGLRKSRAQLARNWDTCQFKRKNSNTGLSKTEEISEPLLFNLDIHNPHSRNSELSVAWRYFSIPYLLSAALYQGGSKMCQSGMDRSDPVSRNVAHHGGVFCFKILTYFLKL